MEFPHIRGWGEKLGTFIFIFKQKNGAEPWNLKVKNTIISTSLGKNGVKLIILMHNPIWVFFDTSSLTRNKLPGNSEDLITELIKIYFNDYSNV